MPLFIAEGNVKNIHETLGKSVLVDNANLLIYQSS